MKEKSEKVALKLNIQKTKIVASSPITSWQIDGKTMKTDILFSWAPKSLWMVITAMKLEDFCSLKGSYDIPRQHIKKQRHHSANKSPYSQRYDFSKSDVQM